LQAVGPDGIKYLIQALEGLRSLLDSWINSEMQGYQAVLAGAGVIGGALAIASLATAGVAGIIAGIFGVAFGAVVIHAAFQWYGLSKQQEYLDDSYFPGIEAQLETIANTISSTTVVTVVEENISQYYFNTFAGPDALDNFSIGTLEVYY
jgi:hypothetical protein